jgi:hypothetical protein
VQLYGHTVTTQVFVLRALWYAALPDQPVRIVLVRDPHGRRQLDAFFCTDLGMDAGFILEAYACRWCLEVTFHDTKQFLGLAEPSASGGSEPAGGAADGAVRLPGLRLGPALVRRARRQRAAAGLASATVVSPQGRTVLPGYAQHAAAGWLAGRTFCVSVPVREPSKIWR